MDPVPQGYLDMVVYSLSPGTQEAGRVTQSAGQPKLQSLSPKSVQIKFCFGLLKNLCMNALPTCVYVYHMCLAPAEVRRVPSSDSLELELWVVLSHHMHA